MNQLSKAEQEWLVNVRAYRKLEKFGFREKNVVDQHGRLKEVRFQSENFVFVVGVDLLKEENFGYVLDANSLAEMPSPHLALCYFLPNLNELIARYDHCADTVQELETTLQLYGENKWVIQSKTWTRDEGFLSAIKFANEWMWQEFRPLKRWEYEAILHGQRLPNVHVPE